MFRKLPRVGLYRTFTSVCQSDLHFTNPYERLQNIVQKPFSNNFGLIFNPSIEEMKTAKNIFNTKMNKIDLICATHDPNKFPQPDLPEIAFVGRSNVGKSTLLKALINKSDDMFVKVSSKPGHTKSLNFYKIENQLILIDNPGYGFNQPGYYPSAFESLLRRKQSLKRIFLLIDSSIGIKNGEEMMFKFFKSYQVPYAIVFTKIDKVKDSKLLQTYLQIKKYQEDNYTTLYFSQPFLVSGETMAGIGMLQAFIGHVTNTIHKPSNLAKPIHLTLQYQE